MVGAFFRNVALPLYETHLRRRTTPLAHRVSSTQTAARLRGGESERHSRSEEIPRVVVHVVLSLNVGGLERIVLRLLEHVDRRRYRPIVCALEEAGALAIELARLDVPLRIIARRRGFDPHAAWELAGLLSRERAALVHTHNPTPHVYGSVAAALSLTSRRRPRVVHTKHGRNTPGSPRKVLLNHMAAMLTDRLVAVGEDTRAVLLDIERVPAAKVVTIANGVDVDEYRPGGDRARARALLGVPLDAFHIGCVARLVPDKDHPTLLRAFAELRRRRPGARLTLVGDGPSRGALEALAAELGIAVDVLFAGTRGDVAALLAAFDVFALSSVTEGLSLTLVEAASAGLPIVATRVGSNAEIVAAGETGLLVAPRDPHAFACALEELFAKGTRDAMGQLGRARAVEHFGVAEMARRYERLYDEVLGIACDRASP